MIGHIVDCIVTLAAVVAILDYFGVKPKRPSWGLVMPLGRNWKLGIMLILVAASLGMSGYGFYRSLHPKIVEKTVTVTVDKPVDRVVEKLVPQKCPKTHSTNVGVLKNPLTPAQDSQQPPGTAIIGAKNTKMDDVTISGFSRGIDLSPSEHADLQHIHVFASGEELRSWFDYLLKRRALDEKPIEDAITAKQKELAKSGKSIPPDILRQLRELERDPEKLKAFLEQQNK
jgi:hypothetical protein